MRHDASGVKLQLMAESVASLRIAVAGDVMLGRTVAEMIAARGFGYPWGDVLPYLREADLFLVNLECALTRAKEPWRDGRFKAFYFRSEPEAVETLRLGGVDFACLANNHAADFGMDGLLEAIRVLDEAGIANAGAGADVEEASAPVRLDVAGVRVGITAFADHPEEWAAAPGQPGINYIPISPDRAVMRKVEAALRAARQDADFVVFTIHWGPNMRSRPTSAFREFARAVISVGADLFWGHSAHLVQGVEFWKGKPILYDTGDFVDDYAVDSELCNDLSALFRVRVRPPQVVSVEAVPVAISDMRVNLARGTQRARFLRHLTALCAEMNTRVVQQEHGPALTLLPFSASEASRAS
jgi:poly-gamma-glutamate capsule biosynthesis protein CapA/YwtB (metallophosphatase superfamily)